MKLVHTALAGLALLAIGGAARLLPATAVAIEAEPIAPLASDLCTPGETACLPAEFTAADVADFYRLPPRAAAEVSVGCDGTIAFAADSDEEPEIDCER